MPGMQCPPYGGPALQQLRSLLATKAIIRVFIVILLIFRMLARADFSCLAVRQALTRPQAQRSDTYLPFG